MQTNSLCIDNHGFNQEKMQDMKALDLTWVHHMEIFIRLLTGYFASKVNSNITINSVLTQQIASGCLLMGMPAPIYRL